MPKDPRNNSLFHISAILLLVFLITRIPIKEHLPYSALTSDDIEKVIISSMLICLLMLIINRLRIPHSYCSPMKPKAYIYYLPAIVSVFLFTNGLNDLFIMSGSTFYSGKAFLYGAAKLARALFEEILFRGAIFGLLINKYHGSKHGVLKSSIISGLIFGFSHIVNVWVYPERDTSYTTTQIYAATWLGVMYCAIYVKTRSIIVLGVIHFINNFFACLKDLENYGIVIEAATRDSTTAEAIASEIFGLVYFAIPLFMGLYIMKKITREDVEKFITRSPA